jgi:phenylalanyl-tRNA synthetase alpha chain
MVTLDELNKLADQARDELQAAAEVKALEDYRVKYFGRKGLITQARSLIGQVAPEERAEFGKAVNSIAKDLEAAFQDKQNEMGSATTKAAGPLFDVTLPGTRPAIGRPHVLTQTIWELCDIFERMGFEVIEAPEVEDEWHNFQALNIPLEHPARDPLENFYINSVEHNTLLRSQTSTAQIRIMEQRTPPVRVVHVGRVYRPDTIDAKHHMMFHQIEALYVDRGVSMIDLKSTIDQYLKAYFGPDAKIRLRPSYFPFTEPSAEVDTTCMICHGQGCKNCNGGWMEIGGCGVVDPNVLKAVGYDPEVYSGFAFGFGIERMAMRKHDIKDIRWLTENDVRFLQQF